MANLAIEYVKKPGYVKISLNVTVLLLRKEKMINSSKIARIVAAIFLSLHQLISHSFFRFAEKGLDVSWGKTPWNISQRRKGFSKLCFSFYFQVYYQEQRNLGIQLFLVTLHFGCVVIIPMQAVKYSWFLYCQATLVGHAVSIGANYATNPCKRIKYC